MWWYVLAAAAGLGIGFGVAYLIRTTRFVVLETRVTIMAEPVQAKIRCVETDEQITLRGSARLPGGHTFVIEETPQIFVPRDYVLVGAPSPPGAIFTAEFVGLPSQLVQSNSVQLDVDLFSFAFPGGPGSLVEDYDPTHWDKAIVTNPGGATLTGPNGDLLTAGSIDGTLVVEFTYNVAASSAEGTVATGTLQVVATVTQNTLEIYNVPADVIEGQSYTLLSRELDGATSEVVEDPATSVTWNVDSGPASITGGNTLNIDAASAPASVQVSVSKTGVTGDSVTLNVIVAPAFPDNEPAGNTQVMQLDGSTLVLPGPMVWVNKSWESSSRFAVVSDAESKFGNVIEKRAFVGDTPGWLGGQAETGNAFNPIGGGGVGAREVYFRIVFKRSSNFQQHPSGDKFLYVGRKFPGVLPASFTIGSRSTRIKINNAGDSMGSEFPGTEGDWMSEGAPPITNGVYHTLEVQFRANTQGNADGFMRCWFDDFEVPTWELLEQPGNPTGVVAQDIQWKNDSWFTGGPNSGFNGWQMFYFWGGSGSQKSVNDHTRISEIYVSGRN